MQPVGDIDGDAINATFNAVTDIDGNYSFPGLVVDDGAGGSLTYALSINPGTLPAGVVNTVDPDAVNDGAAAVTISSAAPLDPDQDFGYEGTGFVGDLLFLDVDGDGTPASGEGISAVTVTLSGDFDGDGTAEVVSASSSIQTCWR